MRKVAIVAPQFPPSNLTAGHRARYFAMHLQNFGWTPTILTVEPGSYEGNLEPDLLELVPESVRVIRTRALATKPLRLVGDVGIRAFWWHYRALAGLARNDEVDFVYIPIPPNYSAMLGPLIKRRYGVPYGIDFIDPWVHPWPGSERRFSKAWLAYNLGRWLEPRALRRASLITAVAPGYYEGARDRYPWLRSVECVAMPYGAEEKDFALLERHPRTPYLFDPEDGRRHIVYAGAMLPQAFRTLELLFEALVMAQTVDRELAASVCFHFVGTGTGAGDLRSGTVAPVAARFGIESMISEHPGRIPYLDVLAHLKAAHAVLVLGSTEVHYTPSKVFQAVLSRRPVIALLHHESSAVRILAEAETGHVVEMYGPDVDSTSVPGRILDAVEGAIREGERGAVAFRDEALADYTAEASARTLARALDRVTDAA